MHVLRHLRKQKLHAFGAFSEAWNSWRGGFIEIVFKICHVWWFVKLLILSLLERVWCGLSLQLQLLQFYLQGLLFLSFPYITYWLLISYKILKKGLWDIPPICNNCNNCNCNSSMVFTAPFISPLQGLWRSRSPPAWVPRLFCRFQHSSPFHKLLGCFSAMMVEEETVGGVERSNLLPVLSIKFKVEEIQILLHSFLVNGLRDDDYVAL